MKVASSTPAHKRLAVEGVQNGINTPRAVPISLPRIYTMHLQEFLNKHYYRSNNNNNNSTSSSTSSSSTSSDPVVPITNVRIGDKSDPTNFKGGRFAIPEDEYAEFLELHNRAVFEEGHLEYLVETQLKAGGPILIDVDMRFAVTQTQRVYTQEHIRDFLDLYLDEFKNLFQMDADTTFPVFVMEKETTSLDEKNQQIKDGIHVIFGIKMDHPMQMLLRSRILPKLEETWSDFPLINSWNDVLDKVISAGTTGWQLYGSRKPHKQAYQLTQVYQMTYDPVDGEFREVLIPVQTWLGTPIQYEKLNLLSARYRDHIGLYYKQNALQEATEKFGSSTSTSLSARRVSIPSTNHTIITDYPRIASREELNLAITAFEESIGVTDFELKEAYNYTMILPPTYYEPGSYDRWIRVGWALRNISNRLYVVWIAFSSQSTGFRFETDVAMLHERWLGFAEQNPYGLTKYSLIHWANLDGEPAKVKSITETSIDYFIDQTLNGKEGEKGCGDFDLANVLFHLFKHKYKCVSVKGNMWYSFNSNRWEEIDSGSELRKAISTTLRELYRKKSERIIEQLALFDEAADENNEEAKKIKKIKEARITKILDICRRLATTTDKNHMMTEAKELFHDSQFFNKLDTNEMLLGCRNGVIDFKDKVFRRGYPEDYISKSTGIDYIPIDPVKDAAILAEINDFMAKLFPLPELREYMWQHLASTLMGTTTNQTLNMYIGVGQNGKSALVLLMKRVLGDYKGVVPLAIVTSDRPKIGGLSPEVVLLKGVRYAVMQEPSKGQKICEGPMKELTGGDELMARALHMPPVIFKPQFKLAVCSNEFMEIKSQDHGTWRRIRVVDFMSLFVDNPVQGDIEKPYQFKLVKNIEEKFDQWKEVFLAMLVEKVFQTEGNVMDCDIVLNASAAYQKRQDSIAEFISEKLVADPRSHVSKQDVNSEFERWYSETYGQKDKPQLKDVHEYLNKKLCRYNKEKKGWLGWKIAYEPLSSSNEAPPDEDEVNFSEM